MMPRKRKAPTPPSRAPRNPWQLARGFALASKGFTRADVHRELGRRSIRCAASSVNQVIDGRYRNADIQRVFCEMTGTEDAVMFPADEPVYTAGRAAPKPAKARRPRATEGT